MLSGAELISSYSKPTRGLNCKSRPTEGQMNDV